MRLLPAFFNNGGSLQKLTRVRSFDAKHFPSLKSGSLPCLQRCKQRRLKISYTIENLT